MSIRSLACILVVFVGVGLAGSAALAASSKNLTVSRWAYKRLEKAQTHLSDEEYKDALELLDEMKERERLNDHERALMWQTYGYIYSSQEKYKKAAECFEECLALDALHEGAALSTQYNLGQIYVANEQYKKAAETLADWFKKAKKPTPDAYYLLAAAYSQIKQYKSALPHIQKAVAAKKRPPEGWLQLLLAIQFELNRYRDVAATLKSLIQRFPKKVYWTQLSGIYGELNDDESSLAVLELTYHQGYLTKEAELLNLARYFVQQGAPYKASRVVEASMERGTVETSLESLSLLASALTHAREFEAAAKPLGQAANLSDTGDLYIQLAQLHIGQARWKQATRSLQAAIDKGGLSDPGNAHVLLGISNFSAKNFGLARRAFQEALTYAKSKANAEKWLKVTRQQLQP